MLLGICSRGQIEGRVYEGESTSAPNLVLPRPILMPARIIGEENFDSGIEPELVGSRYKYLFREDDFDFVTRIRRGRFYRFREGQQPLDWNVNVDPPCSADRFMPRLEADTYESILSTDFFHGNGKQGLVVLGARDACSIWIIVNKELVFTREILVTLKARKSFGVLPQVDWNKVPDKSGLIKEKIECLIDDVYRAGAESVVDRSREAATAILSAYLQSKGVSDASGKDLGGLIKLLEDPSEPNTNRIVRCAAEIPQRLHSRGKHAERERRDNLRSVTEQDAELSVQCVAVMLCDLGWAQWV